MGKTRIEFLYHHGEHVPGDTADVDEATASRLVHAKRAKLAAAPKAQPAKRPAKKAAARKTPPPSTDDAS